MDLSTLMKSKVLGGVLLVGSTLGGILSGGPAWAANDTSTWSKPPSWATGDDSSTTGNGSTPHKSSRTALKDVKPASTNTPFAPNSHNISLELGEIFLMGDLTKYTNAIGAQLHYTYGVSDLFGFDSSVGFSQHSEGQFSMINALVGMRVNISWFDKIIPYGTVGFGFYRASEIPDGMTDNVAALLFGVNTGLGIDLQMTKFLFFGAGATFHDVFGNSAKSPTGASYTLGGMYFSVLAHAGVSF